MTNLKPQTAAKKSRYLPTLDGWRAVAIIWVMLGHDHIRFHSTFRTILEETGGRGVQLFFALSGLLICGRLLQEEAEAGSISLRGFYIRRLFRIQPASLVFLLCVAILSLAGVIPAFWKGIFGALFMIRNLWPVELAGYAYWFTGHFWSLAVEEHFYLLFPAFLVLVKRYRLAILCVGVVLVEEWRIIVFRHPALHFGTTVLRTDVMLGGILLGCAAAVALRVPRFRVVAERYLQPWVAFLYTALVFWRLEVHHSTYDNAILITVYPLLIVSTMLHPGSVVGRFLELPPLRFVGRISYSLYLWQELFFVTVHPPEPGSFRSHGLLCWISAFACATASYYLVETPMIRRGHRIAMRYTRAPSEEQRPEPTVV